MKSIADQLKFDRELAELLKTRTVLGRSGTKHQATGLSSANNLIAIRNLILQRKPRQTLEVGLAYGASAVAIARSLHDCHPDGEFHHTAIDPGQGGYDYAGVELLRRAKLLDKFTLHESASDLILLELFKSGNRYDFIYIDGSHIFEHVFIDMFYSIRLLKEGGVVFFDDCADKHVKKVLAFVTSNLFNQLEEMSLTDLQPRKPFLKRLANRLGYNQLRAFVKRGDLPRAWNAPLGAF